MILSVKYFPFLKSKIVVSFCLLLSAVSVFGQDKKTFSLGLLAEANANTRRGYGLAGGLQTEFSFTDHFAAGIKTDFGTDFYDVSSAELMAYGRWYFGTAFPVFVQAGAGGVVLMEHERRVFSVLGDGTVGLRFSMQRFYTESYVRFGWPAGFGFGLVAGIRFGGKKTAAAAAPQEQIEESGDNVPEGLEIHFFGYATNFEIIGPDGVDTLIDNISVLYAVSGFMKENPQYRVIVTGHANPVIGSKEEEITQLIPLSEGRAEFVRSELVKLGVPDSRILTHGAGGSDSGESPVSNRSVTFRFEKDWVRSNSKN